MVLISFGVQAALPKSHETDLEEVSTGSGSDLVTRRDQVATAPCTDRVQR